MAQLCRTTTTSRHIQRSFGKNSRRAELTEEPAALSSSHRLSTENCEKKTWRIAVEPPFGNVELTNVAENWQPRKTDNTLQQIASSFRYCYFARDVRCYDYDKVEQKGKPSNHQSKRAGPQIGEDEDLDLEDTENYRQSCKLPKH
ncbi:hypothetical protein ANCCAN_23015 [Ancylostoma caninum]|uniref:Uncharacterized protein n=1 Tax=Ancylostoma caninum TaxID=29170 RepID=A0A368FJN9_ANCCA|nr:hypothetical protein ANCCAN_23015 [Ancylostoma caninum]